MLLKKFLRHNVRAKSEFHDDKPHVRKRRGVGICSLMEEMGLERA
jgi:hypothetical protein